MAGSFQSHFTAHSIAKLPLFTLSFVVFLALCYLLPSAFDHLYFERTDVEQGQWWRTITSQWVHLSPHHFFYNAGAMLVVGSIVESRSRIDTIGLLVAGLLLVGLLLPYGRLDRYAGLSGALNALVLPAIWIVWSRSKSIIPVLVCVLYLGRLGWEWLSGQSVLNPNLVWPSYTPAHLQGLAAGIVWLGFRGKALAQPVHNKDSPHEGKRL